MKALLNKEVSPPVHENVEVELPHYWVHDHGGEDYESTSWGCIDEHGYTTISRSRFANEYTWSVETETRQDSVSIPDTWACYFKDEHVSDKAEYEQAAQECVSYVNTNLAKFFKVKKDA